MTRRTNWQWEFGRTQLAPDQDAQASLCLLSGYSDPLGSAHGPNCLLLKFTQCSPGPMVTVWEEVGRRRQDDQLVVHGHPQIHGALERSLSCTRPFPKEPVEIGLRSHSWLHLVGVGGEVITTA